MVFTGGSSSSSDIDMRTFMMAYLQFVILILAFTASEVHASTFFRGVVQDEEGKPIENANISVWLMNKCVASRRANANGYFEIELEAGASYVLYILADNPSTPGIDYLPLRSELVPSDGDVLKFALKWAGSLVFIGDSQFVESEKIPLSLLYTVLDPKSNEVMCVEGFPLMYGYAPESQSTFLGLEHSHLVVPSGVPFTIEVNSSIATESGRQYRCFKVGESNNFMLETGQLATIDIRRYSTQYNLDLVETLLNVVDSKIEEMETLGFYLATEKGTALTSLRQLSEAGYLYEKERYIESFDAAKRSFIALRQTLIDVAHLYDDAAFSVYMLILFINFVSIAIAFLLLRTDPTKLLGSLAIYLFLLAILYLTYPGSVIIPFPLFVGSAALTLVASLMVVKMLPHFMSGKGGKTQIPVRNIIVPILSMAKRNINRRKLKYALTLISIMALVTSFVLLTSFSKGYGLVVSRLNDKGAQSDVVMIRAPGYNKAEPIFLTSSEIYSGWLEKHSENKVISPKAENSPVTQPVAHLNDLPIFGVLGIDPAAESTIINLKDVLVKGELPSEGGILISEALRMRLKLEVGDELVLSDLTCKQIWIEIQGVFDDRAFSGLRDLDDSTYLPEKLLDVTPEASPTFIPVSCEPFEIIIANLSTALKMPLVGITRVDITVREEADVKAFAERLALERGYDVWFSSADGVYLTRLGGYMEVKALPLIVPWGIVTLNVMMTMLNSIYERKKEIQVLSSVGLNPSQISAIFVAEAFIIGIIAGGLGYLVGLSLYRAIAFLGLAIEVRQKVSAFWSFATICIALTAVITGALPVLMNSTTITPSLMRRWRIEGKRVDVDRPFELPIPVKLLPEETDDFIDFVVRALKAHEDDYVRKITSIRVLGKTNEVTKRIVFVYKATNSLDAGNFYTNNIIIIEKMLSNRIEVKLQSQGVKNNVYTTGNLIRNTAMQWSTVRGEPV